MATSPVGSEVSEETIDEAVKSVKAGGVIIFPTDTVYGLGCDPAQTGAVQRIFQLKQRHDKPLPILSSSIEIVGEVAELSEQAMELGASFWPGALTLILKRRKGKFDEPALKLPTIGVRVPGHGVPLQIAERTGGFLVGTSANISGSKTPASFDDIPPELVKSVDYAIRSSPSRFGRESTIVDATRIPPTIVREGALKRDVVEEYFRGSP